MNTSSPRARTVVLIVEDEPILMMDAVDLVEDCGFEALEASNADAALEILLARPDIRIVLTDIDMPGSMDGVKLAQLIRGRWPPIEIIIVSGHRTLSKADMPERSVFFAKPFKHDHVAAALRKFFT